MEMRVHYIFYESLIKVLTYELRHILYVPCDISYVNKETVCIYYIPWKPPYIIYINNHKQWECAYSLFS